MKATIQSIHFDADVKLTDFIQAKLGKLSSHYDGIIDAQVYLKLDKNKQAGNKVVEVKLLVPSGALIASQQAKSFEEAADKCVDYLRRQISRHKSKDQK